MGHGTIDLIMIGDSTRFEPLTSLFALYLFIYNLTHTKLGSNNILYRRNRDGMVIPINSYMVLWHCIQN